MEDDTSELMPKNQNSQRAQDQLEISENPIKVNESLIESEEKKENQNSEEIKENQKLEEKKENPVKRIIMINQVKCGHYKSVFRLIEAGTLPADVILEGQSRWYLIHYLVMHNKLMELKVLLTNYNPDINVIDAYKQTALHLACVHVIPDIMKYLSDQPTIQLNPQDYFQATPLINTVKSKFILGFIYLYFEKGSDPKIKDTNGFSIAHWAAYKGYIPFLQLIKYIPDLSEEDKDETSLAFNALMGISYDSLKYLAKSGKIGRAHV